MGLSIPTDTDAFGADAHRKKALESKPLLARAGTHCEAIARQLFDVEVLYFLNSGPRSGYELRKLLLRAFGINMSYGTLYPHLHSLEESGLISGMWSKSGEVGSPLPRKRTYALTQQGWISLKMSIGALWKIATTMQFIFNGVDLQRAEGTPLAADKDSIRTRLKTALEATRYEMVTAKTVRGFSGINHRIELAVAMKTINTTTTTSISSFSSEPDSQTQEGSSPTRDCTVSKEERRNGVPSIDTQDGIRPHNGLRGDLILLGEINGANDLSIIELMKMAVVAQDLGAKAAIIATPKLQKDLLCFCESYGIGVYEGEDLNSALEALAYRLTR
jgi:DNA-binding PadR family transcriptional regulator